MSKWAILPRRWRVKQDAARHAATIAAILDTPPIAARRDGVVLFGQIGTASVLPFLVAVKSLRHHLGKGRVAVLDDGTLTGSDRAILAHHCGDPEIIAEARIDRSGFPEGHEWARLLAILDRRASEYWLALGCDTVTIGPVPELAEALALNRSIIMPGTGAAALPLGEFAEEFHPGGPADGDGLMHMESRLGKLPRPDWRYIRASAALAGFAAGGPGRAFAAAVLAHLRTIAPQSDAALAHAAPVARNILLASEPRGVVLPPARYGSFAGEGAGPASFVHFAGQGREHGAAFAAASQQAIATLHG